MEAACAEAQNKFDLLSMVNGRYCDGVTTSQAQKLLDAALSALGEEGYCNLQYCGVVAGGIFEIPELFTGNSGKLKFRFCQNMGLF